MCGGELLPIFWSNRSLIAAGEPAWPPAQKAGTCQALVLLPVPSHSSTPELCQEQNTASIQAVENTRDSQNLRKSKTPSFGSRQWQMPRCPYLHTCICSLYHLCNCLKAMRDYLVASTDALCKNVLPSSGSALHLNEVWNHIWAGELDNSRRKENGEKEEGRHKSRGMVPGRSLRADGARGGLICVVYSAPEMPQWFTFWSIPSSAWQGAGTALAGIWNVQTQLICVVDEHISHNAEGGLEKMSWQLWLQLRCLQVLFCPPERAERQLVCKERTWGVIWRKREMLPSQRWSLQIQKEILKVLNYTRIQKAGKVMSLQ